MRSQRTGTSHLRTFEFEIDKEIEETELEEIQRTNKIERLFLFEKKEKENVIVEEKEIQVHVEVDDSVLKKRLKCISWNSSNLSFFVLLIIKEKVKICSFLNSHQILSNTLGFMGVNQLVNMRYIIWYSGKIF